MITLIIIVYIFASLCFSLGNMRDSYSLTGDIIKASEPKEAFILGFLTLPILALLAGVFIGLTCLVIWLVGFVLESLVWIYNNMP